MIDLTDDRTQVVKRRRVEQMPLDGSLSDCISRFDRVEVSVSEDQLQLMREVAATARSDPAILAGQYVSLADGGSTVDLTALQKARGLQTGGRTVPPSKECPVCFELLADALEVIPCSHVFCSPCISSWQQQQHTIGSCHCPVCRTAIDRHQPVSVLHDPRYDYPTQISGILDALVGPLYTQLPSNRSGYSSP
jgi:hypothetical protein